MPLETAYARTIHKFQGLQAGPTEIGKPANAHECIVCDPDGKECEKQALGLFYTAASRGTTLGDENGLNSAIYFAGDNFSTHRFTRLTKMQDGITDFKRSIKRKNWVAFLHDREAGCKARITGVLNNQNKTIKFCMNATFDDDFVRERVQEYLRAFVETMPR